MLEVTLVDVVVALGVALVLPVALGGRWRTWLVAAAATLIACAVQVGTAPAVAATLPLGMAVLVAGGRALHDAGVVPWRWGPEELARLAAPAFAGVAWTGLVASCAGLHPFGIADPFNQLAAVHFTYVGGGAVPLAGAALAHAEGLRERRVARAAVGLTVGAPPIVGLGFVTDRPWLLLGGALLMTAAVWTTGALELHRARRERGAPVVRALLTLSGLAVVVPMVLAVLWAAGQRWDVPVLSIPAMVRTHGAGNALGFVGAGLLALLLERRTRRQHEDREVMAWS